MPEPSILRSRPQRKQLSSEALVRLRLKYGSESPEAHRRAEANGANGSRSTRSARNGDVWTFSRSFLADLNTDLGTQLAPGDTLTPEVVQHMRRFNESQGTGPSWAGYSDDELKRAWADVTGLSQRGPQLEGDAEVLRV